MYLGAINYDVPVATVSQDPLSVAQSNIPGLVMSAPDVMVGAVPDSSSSFPTWLLVVGVLLLVMKPGKKRR